MREPALGERFGQADGQAGRQASPGRRTSGGKPVISGGLTRGAIGGVVGAVVGYFAGNMAAFALGGASAGAAAGGAWGTHSVKGDTTTADWQLSPVVKHNLTGYSHNPVAQTSTDSKGNVTTTGYWHYYSPDVELEKVGDNKFWEPVVRHSSDDK